MGRLKAAAVLGVAVLLAASSVSAQGSNAGSGWRAGVSFGGISTVGLTFEAFRDAQSIEVTLGTFGFRDLGVAVAGKHYFGERAGKPYVGLGLWGIIASNDPRNGLGLIARVPLGLDWNVRGRHAVGAEVAVNRALTVRRPDPDDERELNKRLVPLPGIYYRYTP